jgi:hypothetical protein
MEFKITSARLNSTFSSVYLITGTFFNWIEKLVPMLEIAKYTPLDTYWGRGLLFKNGLKHHAYCFALSHSTSLRSLKVSFLPFTVYSNVIESSLIISWPLSSRRFFKRVDADQGMKNSIIREIRCHQRSHSYQRK